MKLAFSIENRQSSRQVAIQRPSATIDLRIRWKLVYCVLRAHHERMASMKFIDSPSHLLLEVIEQHFNPDFTEHANQNYM